MLTLSLRPSIVSYTVKDNDGLAVTHEGPRSRTRRGVKNSRTLNVSWLVSSFGYQYLRAVFRTGLKEGSEPFIVPMIYDEPEMTSHKAVIVPGSFKLNGTTGLSFVVEATLEVERQVQ